MDDGMYFVLCTKKYLLMIPKTILDNQKIDGNRALKLTH